ncbi:Succinate--CoA ligase [ADP-forming] subunit alpha [subsurface metagenome]
MAQVIAKIANCSAEEGHRGWVGLTYDVVSQLTSLGIGQSTSVGIGGDPLPGSTFVDILRLFEEDEDTKAVVLIGEIGGTLEQEAAEFIRSEMTKPVVAFIAGSTAPPGRRMGHAGAIITGTAGKASEKIKALSAAGAIIAPNPAEVGLTTKRILPKP